MATPTTQADKASFRFFESEGVLCRIRPSGGSDVWWPRQKLWHLYPDIDYYTNASPLTTEQAKQMIGDGDLYGPSDMKLDAGEEDDSGE